MMLAVADSVIECGDVDEAHLLATMAASHDAARGYGKGTRAAFRVWNETGSWELASRALWEEGSRGNGAAARVAPVAILHRTAPLDRLRSAARRSAMPTHSHQEAIAGAELVAMAIWLALKGVTARDLLAELVVMGVPESLQERVALIDLAQPAEEAVPLLGHGVLTIESVPLALWAHCRNNSFERAVLEAVCAAGDTDTIGAMTGAIAGATYGAQSIPESWVEAVDQPSLRRLRQLARELCSKE
jgi:poly(ADP-ribose) glycohydrolase ARH3